PLDNLFRGVASDVRFHRLALQHPDVLGASGKRLAIVTIFNRIKLGSNAQGWAALGPPVIQSARRHALEQARDVIGWPRRALVARASALIRAAERAPI